MQFLTLARVQKHGVLDCPCRRFIKNPYDQIHVRNVASHPLSITSPTKTRELYPYSVEPYILEDIYLRSPNQGTDSRSLGSPIWWKYLITRITFYTKCWQPSIIDTVKSALSVSDHPPSRISITPLVSTPLSIVTLFVHISLTLNKRLHQTWLVKSTEICFF